MSAVPRYPENLSRVGLRLTATEFLSLGETDERLELVDGVVVLSPRPGFRHQRVAKLVLQQLLASAAASSAEVLYEIDVVLASGLVYCPDIVVFREGRLKADDDTSRIAPDLAVEILSRGTESKDLVTKRDDYERHGVGEYWVVDPHDASVRVFSRDGARFVEQSVHSGLVHCGAVPGLSVNFEVVRRALAGT